ncbi:hypothetical protein HBB16_15190 [Pseudonocardia sp. MCCB 268]|nr:hypothetical protein [Pseudonocardia cytotoxica]
MAAQWLRDGATAARRGHDLTPADAVWTFTGPKPSAWWVRRRRLQATVHRADIFHRARRPVRDRPELAADGVSSGWACWRPAGRGRNPRWPRSATLHLHATDDISSAWPASG